MRNIIYVLIVIVLIGAVISGANMLFAQDGKEEMPQGTDAKLEKIIQNQQLILGKLEALEKELYIVKIRATAR